LVPHTGFRVNRLMRLSRAYPAPPETHETDETAHIRVQIRVQAGGPEPAVYCNRAAWGDEISLPRPTSCSEWLSVALLECPLCHEVVERRSPGQRHCAACAACLGRMRSRLDMRRVRGSKDA
jgi:hypothetical protein